VNIAGHDVRRIRVDPAASADDLARVQALIALDLHYWEHVEAAPLRDDEARYLMDDRPPAVPLAHKHVFIVDDVALLDMLEGYPDETTWFLGLIFLAPSVRNRGLGTKLLEAVCDHARGHGAKALRLAVATQHPDARRLYERLDFRFVRPHRRTIHTGAFVDLDVMERAL